MVSENIFFELSLIVIIAVVITSLVRLLRQPLIIGYILAGIAVSPHFLNIITAQDSIATFAEMGVALLLFMVGLNLNPRVVKDVGGVALLTGLGQILFTFTAGFAIGKLLGLTTLVSIYIAIAVSFCSTIIIMKLLSDKKESETLYGKISIGFLIVQDLVAIAILMIISSFSQGTDISSIVLGTLLKGATLIAGLIIFGYYALPKITRSIAQSQELLLLFSLGWALAIASLFSYLGFTIEIGALLAGITLSLSPYRHEMSSKLKPIRDFFILIFFIFLGSQMSFTNITNYTLHIIAFSSLILIGNPIIVMSIMGALGYTKRNSFLAGLTVSQISEFSFILISLGIGIGHLSPEILSVVTLIGLITMGLSSYAVLYSNLLYSKLSRYLTIFERKGMKVDAGKYHQDKNYDIILFGHNRIGYSLLTSFKKIGKKHLVVDFNPETIVTLARKGVDSRYGDASDTELLDELPLKEAKMIISTIPDLDTNLLLLDRLQEINKSATVIVVSHHIDDSITLYNKGASYVVTPHFLGGDHVASLIEQFGLRKNKFTHEGKKKMTDLLARKREGHVHPTRHEDS